MRIVIETIPHADQRYDTCGDWRVDEAGTWQIKVSELGNEHMEFLVGLHELVEMSLCLRHGITEEAVTAFDTTFEGEGEPGDDPAAPYHQQHRFATMIEQEVAGALQVDWDEYDRAVSELK